MTVAASRGRLALLAAIVSGAAFAACMYDFHRFDGVIDADASTTDAAAGGGGDGAPSPAEDGAVADAGVSDADAGSDAPPPCSVEPPVQCLTDAVSCKNACAQAAATCRGNCPALFPQQCQGQCAASEAACRQDCFLACVGCTGDAGCQDPLRCNAAME